MSLFKEVKCFFYSKESNGGIKGKDFECTVVCQSGSSTFVIYEIGLQFIVDEKVLRKLILDNKTIEIDGVYIDLTDKNALPVKCKIKIAVMEGETNFEILNSNNLLQIKNENLKKMLDIK
jgi:hypothetical protein